MLGPPGAAEDGLGEDPRLATQCLLHAPIGETEPEVAVHLRFLQLQRRSADGWDEAIEHDVSLPKRRLGESSAAVIDPVTIAGCTSGSVVRWPLAAEVLICSDGSGTTLRLSRRGARTALPYAHRRRTKRYERR